jgi:hypothetical protein
MAGTDEVEEVWSYGGVRVSGRGQRVHAMDRPGRRRTMVPQDRHARGRRQPVQGHRQTSRRRHLDHRHPAVRRRRLRRRSAPAALGTALGSHHAPGAGPRRTQLTPGATPSTRPSLRCCGRPSPSHHRRTRRPGGLRDPQDRPLPLRSREGKGSDWRINLEASRARSA